MNFIFDKYKNIFILLLILLSAHLSYSINIFNAANNTWFEQFQTDSEQLVLDGLLNSSIKNNEVVLGRYSRPDVKDQHLVARELYAEGSISDKFNSYKSQYGLQIKFFALLRDIGLSDVFTLQSITALLMSFVVTAMFWFVWKDFSFLPALFFVSVYILSPWIVVISRNLYWVSFTWFLPLLTTMWLAPKIYSDANKVYLMSGILFFVYLLKLLCGYEYITTIFFASCIPIVYHGTRMGHTSIAIFKKILSSGVVLVIAFSCALYLHATEINKNNESGFSYITLLAKKRLSSDNPLDTAKNVCRGDAKCEKSMIDSLTSNPIKVAAKYFIMTNSLPWVSYEINTLDKERVQIALSNASISNINDFYSKIDIPNFNTYVLTKVSSIVFFIILLISIVFSFKKFTREIKFIIIISFISPLSWFLAAKGHSYIHTHINYVLWYLPFIPYCMVALTTLGNKKGAIAK